MTIRTTNNSWIERAVHFQATIWGLHRSDGFAVVAARLAGGGRFREQWFDLSEIQDLRVWLADHPRERFDLYACPNAFACPHRRREFALRTPFAWCDLDQGKARNFCPRPNLLLETSPGRKQAVWLFDRSSSVDRAEAASRELTRMADGDANGWSVTKYLRLPFTYNHKPQYDRPIVKVLRANWTPQPFVRALVRNAPMARTRDREKVERKLSRLPNFTETFAKYRVRLHHRVRCLIRSRSTAGEPDRSKCVYEIVCDLHRLNARFDEIATILKCNVYFVDKYGNSDAALAREISRILNKLGDNT